MSLGGLAGTIALTKSIQQDKKNEQGQSGKDSVSDIVY